MISFGSIVQRNLETLSMLEPAAPSAGMPAAAMVAPTSLASRPGQRAFARAEVELAAARRDIDIAHAADHGLRINCRRRIVPFSQHSLAIDDDVQPARPFVRFV